MNVKRFWMVSLLGLGLVFAAAPITQATLIAQWALDENSGTTASDSTGNGSTGTLTNGPTWTSGKYGSALSFDNVDDYVAGTFNPSLTVNGAMTMAAWIYASATPTNSDVVLSLRDTGNLAMITLKANATVYKYGDSLLLAGSQTPASGQWVHLCFTCDGTTNHIYINAVDKGSNTAARDTGTVHQFRIGIDCYGNFPMNGKIDDVRVYDRALSPSEVTALYQGGDTTAPAAVSNLATSSPTSSSITLSWTAPGDDGSTGTATTYDIRYSTSTITAGNWGSATQVTGEPAPQAAGTNQNMVVTGLSPSTTYYFAIETADEVPNWSGLSNVPSGTTTAATDTTPPAAISNLSCSNLTTTSVQLNWTAPGDDGNTGTATTYDIRYSTSTITAGNFSSATQVTGAPTPLAAGTNQNKVVSGLTADTTYYFAMKTADEVPNWSTISNVPNAHTVDSVAPAAVSNLAAGSPTSSSITLSWTAPGDNGSTGTATSYDIRYSTSTITAGNFSSATQVTGAPAPAAAGTNQNVTVSGLSASTTYYFAMKTADEVPNWSAISNVPSGTTSAQTSGLIGLWALDENSGTTASDSTGNGSTGTLTNGPTWTTGKYSNALSFDDVDDYVIGTFNPSLTVNGAMTLAAWIYANATPNWSDAVLSLRDTSTQAMITLKANAAVYKYGDALLLAGSQTPASGQWVHLCFTCDGTTNHIYINAVDKGSNTAARDTGTVRQFRIGMDEYGNFPMNGKIDDVRVYNRALSPSEVTALYQGGTGDTTPPAAVSNLATSSPTSSSITLSWTAPGDDGSTGTATTYDIRYSTATITAGNWARTTQVTGEPAPAIAGTNQNMVVTGLSPSTTYYFAIETADEVPNWSGLSNVPSGTTTAATDTTPPAAVSNLATSNPTNNSITLSWTAPGDDGNTGTATTYDIRYSTSTINTGNWGSATQVIGEPAPLAAGNNQSMTVSGLTANTTYYFAIETADEVPNWSGLSNVPSAATTNSSGNNKPILGPSDFVYQGYYIVQRDGNYNNMAELENGQGFTHRYVGGQLRFLTLSFFGNVSGGGKHVIEFAPPAGGLGGTITTRTNHWPDIMGSTGLDVGSMRWMGLWFEQAQNRLWTTWAIDYPSEQEGTYTKSMVVRTLNADGTVSNIQGPWGLQGVQQRRIYGGVQAVPSWFQSTYGVGPYSAGWGGYSSIMGIGPVSLGPTCYTFPEPTGYPVGDIPSSAFKTLMDHSAASLVVDWYPNGSPTSYDRGVRNADVQNDYDNPKWQSPAPDGLGRWVWGDSNWNTGCWIETSDKQGFITVPKLQNGRGWYQNSNLHCQRQSAEIQVFDPNMLGQVAQGTRASWNTYPTNRWEITSTLTPLGFNGARDGFGPGNGPCGASYDSTTQTFYIYCVGGTSSNSYILVYHVN